MDPATKIGILRNWFGAHDPSVSSITTRWCPTLNLRNCPFGWSCWVGYWNGTVVFTSPPAGMLRGPWGPATVSMPL